MGCSTRLFAALLVSAALAATAHAKVNAPNSWKYDGLLGSEEWWDSAYPMCDGAFYPNQSPINISTASISTNAGATLNLVGGARELSYELYSVISSGTGEINLFNTIRAEVWASELELIATATGIPAIENGTKFYMNSITFHAPTQHPVNGAALTLEAEYVLYRNASTTPGEKPLVIILQFVAKAETDTSRTRYDNLLSQFVEVNSATGAVTAYNGFTTIPVIFPRSPQSDVIVYNGSVSAPPCWNDATVIVYRTPAQVDGTILRNLASVVPTANRRKAQPLNGRRLDAVTVTINADLAFPFTKYEAPYFAAAVRLTVADDDLDVTTMAIQFSTLYAGLVVLLLLGAAGYLLVERRTFVSFHRDEWTNRLDGKANFGSPPAPLVEEEEVPEGDGEEEEDYESDDEDD